MLRWKHAIGCVHARTKTLARDSVGRPNGSIARNIGSSHSIMHNVGENFASYGFVLQRLICAAARDAPLLCCDWSVGNIILKTSICSYSHGVVKEKSERI